MVHTASAKGLPPDGKKRLEWSSMSAVPEPEQQQCKVRPRGAPLAGRAPPQTRAPHVFGVGPCLGASGKPILT